MLQSRLFAHLFYEPPRDDPSINAEFLVRGGFMSKLMAGIWTYLPLGYRVLENINRVIREQMMHIGGVELYMPALQPKELWEKAGRWEVEEMYKLQDRGGRNLGLGWTHEELITSIATSRISSWRDLPQYVFQIQDKFRDEPRAKSGLIRGREFLMKDLYSFHHDEDDLGAFYEIVTKAYSAIFKRLELDVYIVEASGGAFTKDFSHEFQVLSPAGEDEIVYCEHCPFARNSELAGALQTCPQCSSTLKSGKSIEVGNILKLGTKFSQAFNLTYQTKAGTKEFVRMGSYGIGPGRLLGTIVETHHDNLGIIWPTEVAPFLVHLICLSEKARAETDKLYHLFLQKDVPVLFDDREGKTPGERFSDADLIGIPWRVVLSERTLEADKIEVKKRGEEETTLMDTSSFFKLIQ